MAVISCDEGQLHPRLHLAQAPGSFHAVQLVHFQVQEHQMELAGVVGLPAEQPFPRGEFQNAGGLLAGFQKPLQRTSQGEPRVVAVVTDPNAQHGQRLLSHKGSGVIVPQRACCRQMELAAPVCQT